MLYLNPPYFVIDGVSVFPDHADPLQFYYMPAMPHLTVLESNGEQIPQIQLIKYRGEAGNGGFLNFDVNLGIDEATLAKVATKIRELARLDDAPRLAPVPVIDGSVRLLILGKQSGDAATPTGTTPDAPPRFVTKIDQAAKPTLYGDNQATFSVALDQYGVTVLEQALQGTMSPIGVVYTLDYLALRKAYQVRVDVDWDRVQKHMEEHFSVDVLFFSAEIDTVIDELVESRAIVIDVDTFIPESEEDSAILGRRDQAINDVREMITEAFFKPSINPLAPDTDTGDDVAGFFEKLHDAGRAPLRAFTYSKLDMTRIDRKSLDVTMNERSTVRRSIHPQAHLAGLLHIIDPAELHKYIIEVDLDDPWFERRNVTVISRGNFEEDAIRSINVRLNYGDHPQNVLLESSTARQQLNWPSIVRNRAMQREIDYSFIVSFKGVDGTERPFEIASAPHQTDVDNLEINPRELYSIIPVPVVALGFPWDKYPQVEVHLRYTDDANNIQMLDTLVLDEKHAEQIWKLFIRDGTRRQFEYRLSMRAADHRDIHTPWLPCDDERLTIRDPRPDKRKLAIVPGVDWSAVERVFVDVTYEDEANDVFAEESYEFTQTQNTTQTFAVALVDPERRAVQFSATIMLKNRIVIEVPPSITYDRRLIIRSDMRGHQSVVIRQQPRDYAELRIRQMEVEVRYIDEDAGLNQSDLFTFTSPDQQGTFEYDYVDETRQGVEYRVTTRMLNGMSRTTEWANARGEVVA